MRLSLFSYINQDGLNIQSATVISVFLEFILYFLNFCVQGQKLGYTKLDPTDLLLNNIINPINVKTLFLIRKARTT